MAVIEEIPEEIRPLLTKLRFPPSSETIAETKEILTELLRKYSYAKLNKIFKKLGITSNLYYWCLKLRVPVRSHQDAVFSYPVKDFDGRKMKWYISAVSLKIIMYIAEAVDGYEFKADQHIQAS